MDRRLTTRRCVLEPWSEEDAEAVGALLREPTVRRYLLDDQLVERHWVRDRILESSIRFQAGGHGIWAVRVDGAMVGFVGFLPAEEGSILELVYGLHPSMLGQGLATEAASAAIAAYRAVDPADPVWATTDAPNQASQRVLARLGFTAT